MEFHIGQELLFPEVQLKGDILTNISHGAFLRVDQQKMPSMADEKLYLFNGADIWSSPTKVISASAMEEKKVQEINANGDTLDYRKAQFNGKPGHDDRLYDEHSYALPPYLQKTTNVESDITITDDSTERYGASTDGDESERDTIIDYAVDIGVMKQDPLLPGGSHKKVLDCSLRPKQLNSSAEQHTRNCGILPLTEEENRMCEKEGIKMPLKFPLSKAEERIVKRIRRKIRNKRSAQESRKRKQAYVESLEKKVKSCTLETQNLQNRIKSMFTKNKELEQEVARMKVLLEESEKNQTSSASYVTAAKNQSATAVATSDFIGPEMQSNDQCSFDPIACERPTAATPEDSIMNNIFELGGTLLSDGIGGHPTADIDFPDFLGQSLSSDGSLLSLGSGELNFGQDNFSDESKRSCSEFSCHSELMPDFGFADGISNNLGSELNGGWCGGISTALLDNWPS